MRCGKVVSLGLAVLAAFLGCAAAQGQAFPVGQSYIIQLRSTQSSSGLGEYLVPPLRRAFDASGLVYLGGPEARWVATVENAYDVGKWYGRGASRTWLYTRTVTVGLSPGSADIDRGGRLAPHFAVSARIVTPDADRVDEFNCLVALAVRELAARYRPRGRITVDGASCLRAG
jgi:hypothetical protein